MPSAKKVLDRLMPQEHRALLLLLMKADMKQSGGVVPRFLRRREARFQKRMLELRAVQKTMRDLLENRG
jgi:hypothetical protein